MDLPWPPWSSSWELMRCCPPSYNLQRVLPKTELAALTMFCFVLFSVEDDFTDFPGDPLRSESKSDSVVSDSLWPHGLYSPWNSPGQNTGMGSHSLLYGMFPTQVSCTEGRFFTNWAIWKAPWSACCSHSHSLPFPTSSPDGSSCCPLSPVKTLCSLFFQLLVMMWALKRPYVWPRWKNIHNSWTEAGKVLMGSLAGRVWNELQSQPHGLAWLCLFKFLASIY